MRAIPLCVQTALDRGYQITLIKDAIVSSNGHERLDDTLRECEKQGAQVTTASAFVTDIHGYSNDNNGN
jgi:nicotinamidase-related amidase